MPSPEVKKDNPDSPPPLDDTVTVRPLGTTSGTDKPGTTVERRPEPDADKEYRELLTPPQSADELGRLGPYRVLKVLGSGGMGVVFRAEDPSLLRLVALKVMRPVLAASESARQRFLREAQTAAAIRHDHIVTVYQVSEDRGIPYLAMEFLEGEPLDTRLQREGKVPAVEVVRVGREIALGLAAAHKRGLVHRDIKPANIWLEAETGRVKILDFGLARAAAAEGQLTLLGSVVGTPGYMAPEQAQGKTVDQRSDLFSLGCVLYRMATGKPAFHGSDLISTLMAVNTHNPPPPHKLEATVPLSVSRLIIKLLAKGAEGRPPSAQAVVAELERIADEPFPCQPQTKPRIRKRWPRLAGATVGVLLLGTLILWASGVFKLKTNDGPVVLGGLPANGGARSDGETMGLASLRRDHLSAEALALAGDGDPRRAPSALVGVLGEAQPIHQDLVRSVAYSADGRWLASGGFDKNILLRQAETRKVEHVYRGHGGPVMAVAFSRDSRTLVSASQDGTVKLWPVAENAPPQTLEPEIGAIWGMAVSPDGKLLAAGGTSGAVKLWKWGQWQKPLDLPRITGSLWVHFNGNRCAALAFSPDSTLVAVAHGGDPFRAREADKPAAPIHLYRTSDGQKVKTLAGHSRGIRSASDLAFSGDGKYLASFVQDDGVKVWDLTTGEAGASVAGQQFGAVVFTPDSKMVGVSGGVPSGIEFFSVPALVRQPLVSPCPGAAFAPTFSPDGKRLAAGSYTGDVPVWDADTGELLHQQSGHRHSVTALAFGRGGRTLFSLGDDSTVREWDLARPGENRILHQLDTWGNELTASPDGRWVAMMSAFRPLWIFNTTTGTATRLPSAFPEGIIFSPDGKTLAGCVAGSVHLWDLEQAKEVHQFKNIGRSIALAFSADGQYLAAASLVTKKVTVWKVASGEEVHSWPDSVILALAFQPNGGLLAVGHEDGTIGLWDVMEGKPKQILTGHAGAVHSLRFTPDGRTLVSASHDGTLRVWDPTRPRANDVIPLGPANRRLVMDLDPTGQYVIAGGSSPVLFVLRLPTRDGEH